MIKSFADKSAEELFNRNKVRKLSSTIVKVAYRKLLILDAAESTEDLKVPPGNSFEK